MIVNLLVNSDNKSYHLLVKQFSYSKGFRFMLNNRPHLLVHLRLTHFLDLNILQLTTNTIYSVCGENIYKIVRFWHNCKHKKHVIFIDFLCVNLTPPKCTVSYSHYKKQSVFIIFLAINVFNAPCPKPFRFADRGI